MIYIYILNKKQFKKYLQHDIKHVLRLNICT